MTEPIQSGWRYTSQFAEVKGAQMHYIAYGIPDGEPLIYLHGNPTSSYLWRNVIPFMFSFRMNIAPDLIGMGKSDKPDIPYRVFDHAEYFAGFVEALGLKRFGLVLHDWGGFIGMDYAAKHPGRVSSIVLMEAVVKPMAWEDRSEAFQKTFRMFRGEQGRQKIMGENFFVEKVLPGSILRKLKAEEMEWYRAPFKDETSRKPTYVFPNDIPIGGEPKDVVAAVEHYDSVLARAGIPMLLLTFEPGAIIQEKEIAWCKTKFPTLSVQHIGKGIHFVQEDCPHAIGRAIGSWLRSLET